MAFLKISNQTVGDGIANILMMEAILRDLDMNYQQVRELYQEKPSKMYKAIVEDRASFKVTKNELRLIEPEDLQNDIDKILKKMPGSRGFVRPSGTEDILRLYVESTNHKEVDVVADRILKLIENKYKDYRAMTEPEPEVDLNWPRRAEEVDMYAGIEDKEAAVEVKEDT